MFSAFLTSQRKLYLCTIFAEANSTAPDSEQTEWKRRGSESQSGTSRTSGGMSVPNAGKVKFDPPSVPVIFVLGTNDNKKIAFDFLIFTLGHILVRLILVHIIFV